MRSSRKTRSMADPPPPPTVKDSSNSNKSIQVLQYRQWNGRRTRSTAYSPTPPTVEDISCASESIQPSIEERWNGRRSRGTAFSPPHPSVEPISWPPSSLQPQPLDCRPRIRLASILSDTSSLSEISRSPSPPVDWVERQGFDSMRVIEEGEETEHGIEQGDDSRQATSRRILENM